MSPLIEIEELSTAIELGAVLIDARGGADGYQRYLTGHLPEALYADLDKDLAAHPENAAFGGRHPLPALEDFARFLGNQGITPQTHVIVYDDKSGANPAARLWWMLRATGHEKVQVLNGGLQAAVNAGIALSTTTVTATPASNYSVPGQYAGTVNLEQVQQLVQDADHIVIDVRETPRYLGHTEPLDLIAGHIPGAFNLPYIKNLDADGKYLPADQLKAAYNEFLGDIKPENVVVHCGSGVTACHTLLGMAYAGIHEPRLYVGSWSEWSRRALPIAAEERPQG
jgi:thiosulfate/3-mercaptopyruvate sulfurtransferase